MKGSPGKKIRANSVDGGCPGYRFHRLGRAQASNSRMGLAVLRLVTYIYREPVRALSEADGQKRRVCAGVESHKQVRA